jgi:hypothetical protein
MKLRSKITGYNRRILALAGIGLMVLSGCEEGKNGNLFKPKPSADTSTTAPAKRPRSKQPPQDVEAPEIFSKTDLGLWDGRPSLGGIWVAHPDVKEPQRVIIRNTANSKSVIGALFRRERVNPGPAIQVSSEAAAPLGMLAGAPVKLSVIALKREEVAPEPEVVPVPVPAEPPAAEAPEVTAVKKPGPAPAKPAKPAATATTPGAIAQTQLDPVANAAAALDEAEGAATGAAAVAATPAAKPKLFAIQKPYVQAGTFSVEKNAKNAANTLRGIGMQPEIKTEDVEGKTVWRVLVGPAENRAERRVMLKNIKGIGFEDAYFVTQ